MNEMNRGKNLYVSVQPEFCFTLEYLMLPVYSVQFLQLQSDYV